MPLWRELDIHNNHSKQGMSHERYVSIVRRHQLAFRAGASKPGQNAAKGVEALKDKVGDALDRGKSGLADSAYAAGDSLNEDVAKLREDMAAIQKTLSKFASEAGNEAVKTAQNVGSAVASQVGDVAPQVGAAATEYASEATQQVKTFASEMETWRARIRWARSARRCWSAW